MWWSWFVLVLYLLFIVVYMENLHQEGHRIMLVHVAELVCFSSVPVVYCSLHGEPAPGGPQDHVGTCGRAAVRLRRGS